MKRSLIILLIAAILLPCFFIGCDNQKPEVTTPESTTPESTTPETTTPEATTPGDEVVDQPYEGPDITAENVLKRASITTGTSESEIYAGEELAKYLGMKKIEVKDGAFPITLSIDESLEDDAFKITAALSGDGAGITIVGGNGRGVLYGVYKFLEELGGVRYFTPDLETVPTTDIVLEDGVLLEYTPFFEDRRLNWNSVRTATDWCLKQGVNGHDGEMSAKYGGKNIYGSGLFVHTLGALSEYDSNGDGEINDKDDNPCLTSEEVYQTVLKNLRARLEAEPNVNIVSVSQNDRNVYCDCENCAASDAYYSTSATDPTQGGPAGTLLAFVNRIAEELEDEYPDLVIDTLAYNYTQAPPANIVPRENVCIRVCSIRVCFMHPMTECPEHKGPNGYQWTRTKLFMNDFLNWGKICDRIYLWDYTTNFRFYIAPFSNFGAIRENMQFYHENGVRGMFPQGNSQSVSGEFGELRAYLLAKLMWNPYMSEEEYSRHMNEFLKAYYGDGWVYIRYFIDKTTELVANADSCINIYEEPLQSISKEEYLANERYFEELWSKAEAVAGDRAEYVHRSRLQWRCIQILLHPDDEAALAFAAEIEALGIRWAEGKDNNIPIYQMSFFKDLYPNLQPKPEETPAA